eukprot:scaffold770_cov76-Amphora_coffeaeformis.AAC.1
MAELSDEELERTLLASNSQSVVPTQLSKAESHYINSNNDKRTLIVLTIGSIKEIDPDTPPWNTIQRRDIKPRKKDLQDEVKRRSKDMAIPPRPNNWDVNSCLDWLKAHPLNEEDDLSFLDKERTRLERVLQAAAQEADVSANLTRAGQWRGPVPALRLAHCLIEDDIKTVFLRRNDARTRRDLDDRNSETRDPTAYEMIASKWNDASFNPQSVITSCHSDFEVPIDLSHQAVSNLAKATQEKVEDFLTTIRTQLIRLISDWERSGQGEGGHVSLLGEDIEGIGDDHPSSIPEAVYDVSDAEFGALSGRGRPALASRRNFLQGKPSYLLYYWELMDRHQLLASTVQRLDEQYSAPDANSIRSVRSSASKRRRSNEEDVDALRDVSTAIIRLAGEQAKDRESRNQALAEEKRDRVRQRVNTLRDTLRDYRRFRAECRSRHEMDMVNFYNEEIQALEEDINGEEIQLMSQPTPPTQESQDSNDTTMPSP